MKPQFTKKQQEMLEEQRLREKGIRDRLKAVSFGCCYSFISSAFSRLADDDHSRLESKEMLYCLQNTRNTSCSIHVEEPVIDTVASFEFCQPGEKRDSS